MTEDQKLQIYNAQTRNVQELKKAWKQANRSINSDFLKNNQYGQQYNTKILCLIYCALAEAIFQKIIHTPYGLTISQIKQIKKVISSSGVQAGWKKCVELAIQNLECKKSNHSPNVKKKLEGYINSYIYDPSLIRNKIAHGQWSIALNRENTMINQDLTDEINQINIIDLYKKKNALEKLSEILKDIIESPNKAHFRDYFSHLEKFEENQRKMEKWTLVKKIKDIKTKYSYSKKSDNVLTTC